MYLANLAPIVAKLALDHRVAAVNDRARPSNRAW